MPVSAPHLARETAPTPGSSPGRQPGQVSEFSATASVPRTRWIIAIAVMSSAIMEVLDTSVVNVSLPHIAGSLSSSVEEATWVLTSYIVANAIILPITGWLSELSGQKAPADDGGDGIYALERALWNGSQPAGFDLLSDVAGYDRRRTPAYLPGCAA